MVIKYIIVFVLSLFLISCATYNILPQDLKGIYTQKENKRIELHLNDKTFVLKDNFEPTHLAIELYKCCDTITYGNWKIDNSNFLSISTPKELSTFYLNFEVDEKKDFSKDSLYFLIENPIEKFNKKNNSKNRDISYQLIISSNKSKFDNTIVKKLFSTNYITIPIDENLSIESIELVVHIDCKASIRNVETKEIYTLPYEVYNSKTNIFKISIPKLNYGYISYKRLNNDYIKIVNKSTLLWNGKEYVKNY